MLQLDIVLLDNYGKTANGSHSWTQMQSVTESNKVECVNKFIGAFLSLECNELPDECRPGPQCCDEFVLFCCRSLPVVLSGLSPVDSYAHSVWPSL